MANKKTLEHRMSLSYTDQGQWLEIQRTTFKNWVNVQLLPLGLSIEELRTDFADGVHLVALVEALTQKGVSGAVRKPANKYQNLQNITVALDTVAKDGVRIVNIDSSDIAEGNLKLILALVWLLVLRYQGGLSAAQHKRWLLAWLRAVIPECHISNLTTDWNDGVALHALLEYCKPGIAPDWRNLNKEDKLNNCRQAMKLANQHFGIPLVLRPEDLSSPLLDEKSAILYLSYFTREGGPGYTATRDKIQSRLGTTQINNFTTDWNTGAALADLVTSSGGNVPGWDTSTQRSPTELLHLALEGGRELGIEPLLTAAEIAGERSEHLGIMAYTAQYIVQPPHVKTTHTHAHFNGYPNHNDNRLLQKVTLYDDDNSSAHTNASSMSAGVSASQATPTFQLVRKASIKSPEVQMPTHNSFRIDIYSVGVIMESKMTGTQFDPEMFKVEAEAPSGRIIRMTGDGHYAAQFTPDEVGRWRVSMYYNNRFMDGCPIDVCDPSQVRVRDLRGGHVGKQQTFHVDCTGAGQGELGVDITHDRKRVPAFLTETSTPRLFKVTYTPYDHGMYEINVHFNRAEVRDADFHSTDPEERQRRAVFNTRVTEERGVVKINASCDWEIDYVTGGPFLVHVTDSSDIQVYGMKDGTICSSPELIADCTKVGDGVITAEVTHNGLRYPCKVRKDQPGVYRIVFKPKGPGVYKIWISYDGSPVKGSPFVQEIAELGQPVAYGDGLYRGMPNRSQNFTVDPRGNPGSITADVAGPTHNVPCQLIPQSDGTLLGSYVPRETGPHNIDIRMEGKPIEGSPFKPNIVDPDLVRVSGGWRPLMNDKGIIPLRVNKEKQLPFDASQAGPGELTSEVRGPSGRIPVAIDARNDGRHTVIFTPREEGKHYIDVKWGGFPLVNSPYEGYATWEPEPTIYPDNERITLREIPLQRSPRPDVEDKDIIPLQVGQEKELPFDTSAAGPGQLTATVRGPTKQLPVAIDSTVDGKPKVLFTPQEEGKHLIDVNFNNQPLATSPFIGYATKEPNNNQYPPPVYFSGQPLTRPQNEADKDIIPLTVNKEKQLPFDTGRAGPGRLTARVRGPSKHVPVAVEDRGDGKPVVHFTPEEEGKHYIDVNWNDQPIAQSPLIGYATPDHGSPSQVDGLPPVYYAGQYPRDGNRRPNSGDKDIIPLKVNHEKALPFDASLAGPGQLTAAVRGPSKNIPVAVDDTDRAHPTVYFKPEEEGKHNIDVNWNGRPIPQSPLIGYAAPDDSNRYPNGVPPVYLVGHHPRGGRPYDAEKDIIPLKVNHEKQLPFDATDAGPGTMTAMVRGPTKTIPVAVEDRKNGRPTLHFTPEEEGKHYIAVNWNRLPVPKSPFIGYATRDPPPVLLINDGSPRSRGSSRPSSVREDPDVSFYGSVSDAPPYRPERVKVLPTGSAPKRAPPKVILSGRGLKEAEVDKPAVFYVDGTQAGPGIPTARLEGVKDNVPVYVEPVRPQVSKCTYVPKKPGAYKLHVKWNEHPLRGSPFKVNVRGPPKAAPRGIIPPDRNMPAKVGRDYELRIDHPDPSKLTVMCTDPKGHIIPCRFLDNQDGTRSVKMKPTMPGRHMVDIRYNNQHIMGSPYAVDIKAEEVHGKVRVWGPGIQNGVLSRFESNFWVDATGAGAGELRVRIMGPKGAFHVKMRKASQKDKLYQCFYDPVEAGIYTVYVQWSGVHVEGSPFTVLLANSAHELDVMSDDVRTSPRTVDRASYSPKENRHQLNDILY